MHLPAEHPFGLFLKGFLQGIGTSAETSSPSYKEDYGDIEIHFTKCSQTRTEDLEINIKQTDSKF